MKYEHALELRAELESELDLHVGEIVGFSEVTGPMRDCIECGMVWPCDTVNIARKVLGHV